MNSTILLNNLAYVADILQTIATAMGLGLFMTGFFRLKRYGEMRTFMSQQMTLAWPFLMMLGGIALLCLPFILRTSLLNVWGTSNPLRYSGTTNSGFEQLIPPIIIIVRLIGVGAFMKGIVLFSRSGREGMPPGTMAKAMIHILGGLLCVHILGSIYLLKSILGFSVYT